MRNVEEEEHEVGVCTWGGERCGCPAKTAWSTCRRGLCAPVGIAADDETFGVAEESPQTLEGVCCILYSRVSLLRVIFWGSGKSPSRARAGWLETLAQRSPGGGAGGTGHGVRGAQEPRRQRSLTNSWAPVSQVDVSDASLGPEASQEGCRPRLTSGQRGGHDGR
ncbi:protein FAM182B-like [Papio anubis]|uniref:protein FAM182B-like n=1 Tax=Papio anubis TaxID=9555 RepID=UPI0012ADB151|nr:protein FAM182B-like [Papio anubis]